MYFVTIDVYNTKILNRKHCRWFK